MPRLLSFFSKTIFFFSLLAVFFAFPLLSDTNTAHAIAECTVANTDDCNCDGICEVDTLSDPMNCGGCGSICPSGRCDNGVCLNVLGGLVPCGRFTDNPATLWNETAPCNLCHIIPMSKNVIDYLLSIVGLIALLSITIGIFLSVTSFGGSGGLAAAKMAISKSVTGFVLTLVAWVIVNILMILFGFIDPMGDGSWKSIDCDIPGASVQTFCGDGSVTSPNSDGLNETCDPKESLGAFQSRTGLGSAEWVESIYGCNPATCVPGCTTDVTFPGFAEIGEGCYAPELSGGGVGAPCQKGQYVCDFSLATPEVVCKNTYNFLDYKLAGKQCQDIYDECCKDGGTKLPSMKADFDIIRLPTTNITACNDWDCYWPGSVDGYCSCPSGYKCDEICKNNGGKVCIGVGLMDVDAHHCISLKDNGGSSGCSGDYGCNNNTNLQSNDCRANFYTTIWTCDECADLVPPAGNEPYDFSVGETACYCQ